ncbi:MAG: general secretion pathway protein GspB [Steroidobacteraceae bacterium]
MSFILDALKKSESERQCQSGPALFEVKVAPPRHRFAIWAIGLGGLLAINLVVVGWMLWRGGSTHAAAASAAVVAPTPASRTAALASAAGAEAPSTSAATAAPTAVRATAPLATAPPAVAQNAGATHAAGAPGAAGVSADDLAPAVEPAHAAGPEHSAQPPSGVVRETASGLPSYQQAVAEPGANIPDLQLNLHVYSPQADQRFVFLNMMRVREGDTLPKGVHVDQITPDGVILSYHGKQFVLLRR